jgi:energy-coupling factor transporter ATP-binding protein EcfA2
MMLDWKKLTPHRPVIDADAYIARPNGVSAEIVQWVRAGRTVLVGGPTGIGKSTELARAAAMLDDRVACLIPLDRWEDMRRLTADQLLLRVAGLVASLAANTFGIDLPKPLLGALYERAVFPPGAGPFATTSTGDYDPAANLQGTPKSFAVSVLREVTRRSQRRVTLLIDGLEKVHDVSRSEALFDALGSLADEADLVVVIPWSAAFGPRADVVLQQGERLVSVRAVDGDDDGFAFLRDILLNRLQAPTALDEVASAAGHERGRLIERRNVVADAANASGGSPRLFLQLMADAATYASARGGDGWPTDSDFKDAELDAVDFFRRLLLPGDAAALLAVNGTDGRELDLGRKVRLMANGILLERVHARQPTLTIQPLAQIALGAGAA